jgi:concanavalin A-like lectin/glucanase superfamily protein
MTDVPRKALLAVGAALALCAGVAACGDEFVGAAATADDAGGASAGETGAAGGAAGQASGGTESGGGESSLAGAETAGAAGAAPSAATYDEVVLAEKPLVYWRMTSDSHTVIADLSGHGNDLVLQGAGHLPVEDGALKVGDDGALSFDGEASFAIATDARALDFNAGAPFTLECWARRSAGGSSYFQYLLSNVEGVAGNRNGYALYLLPEPASNESARSVFEYDRPAADLGLWGDVIAESAWGHYVAVFDGTQASVYVNGTLADTQSVGGVLVLRTGPFAVARSSSGGSFFRGALDEIAIYSHALGARVIAEHFAFGR